MQWIHFLLLIFFFLGGALLQTQATDVFQQGRQQPLPLSADERRAKHAAVILYGWSEKDQTVKILLVKEVKGKGGRWTTPCGNQDTKPYFGQPLIVSEMGITLL